MRTPGRGAASCIIEFLLPLSMQKFIAFHVKGSAPEPYRIFITKTGETNLSSDCTCAAGINGMACKHVVRILKNNPEGIVDLNMDDFNQVQKWVTGSDVDAAIKALKKAEEHLSSAKNQVSTAKRNLNKALED
jgi:hypothetical protein